MRQDSQSVVEVRLGPREGAAVSFEPERPQRNGPPVWAVCHDGTKQEIIMKRPPSEAALLFPNAFSAFAFEHMNKTVGISEHRANQSHPFFIADPTFPDRITFNLSNFHSPQQFHRPGLPPLESQAKISHCSLQ